jgi:indole-3-glycerol phosphate synthase
MAGNADISQSDALARICADTRAAVASAKARTSVETLRYEIGMRSDAPRAFGSALKEAVANGRYGLIGEIKKASPSGGPIRRFP